MPHSLCGTRSVAMHSIPRLANSAGALIPTLSKIYSTVICRCCMELIGKPVDPHTLHAVLNICVRFTRQYNNARLIAEEGVVEKLLKLTDASNFCGIYGLSTMLIRHILEEPVNITSAIERVKIAFTISVTSAALF